MNDQVPQFSIGDRVKLADRPDGWRMPVTKIDEVGTLTLSGPCFVCRADFQRECRRLLAEGLSAAEIAQRLRLTRVGVVELLCGDDAVMKRRP